MQPRSRVGQVKRSDNHPTLTIKIDDGVDALRNAAAFRNHVGHVALIGQFVHHERRSAKCRCHFRQRSCRGWGAFVQAIHRFKIDRSVFANGRVRAAVSHDRRAISAGAFARRQSAVRSGRGGGRLPGARRPRRSTFRLRHDDRRVRLRPAHGTQPRQQRVAIGDLKRAGQRGHCVGGVGDGASCLQRQVQYESMMNSFLL